jgi:hypothetical protein
MKGSMKISKLLSGLPNLPHLRAPCLTLLTRCEYQSGMVRVRVNLAPN